jgi:putative salt-induced outer membrane protein YdiY
MTAAPALAQDPTSQTGVVDEAAAGAEPAAPDSQAAGQAAEADAAELQPEVAGEMAPGPEQAPPEAEGPFFVPPPPQPESFDWIKLGSGEWLKGDADRMRDGTLEFDSDELDMLNLDWDDVVEFRTEREHTYVFDGRVVVSGTAIIVDDAITIRTGEEVQTFDRADLISIVAGRPRERNYWSGDLGFGLTARSGNSNQSDLSLNGSLMREDALTRSRATYLGSVSEVEGSQTANNHRATLKFDIFLSRRWYVTPLSFTAFKDKFQNIEWRLLPALGVGYHLVDRGNLSWDLELAGGYQYTESISTPALADSRFDSTAAAIFRTYTQADVTEKTELEVEYQLNLGVPDTKKSNHHFLTKFSFDLWWNFDIDLTFVFDRNETPVPDADGNVPKRNDYRLTAGLGWDF